MSNPQVADMYEEWKAAGRPMGNYDAWRATQPGGQAIAQPPQVQGGPSWTPQAAIPAPQQGGLTIQGLQAANAGKSEDFQRFQQGDIARWEPFYDSASGKFKSSRGAPGLFDKPTECPPGQGPSGPNETDPCTSVGYSTPNPWEAQAQTTAAAAPVATPSPLSTILTGLQAQKPTVFGTKDTGFGTPRLPLATTSPVNQPPTGGSRDVTTNGGLSSLLAPLQGTNSGFMAPTTAQNGLTDMLRRKQATRPGGWF